MAWARVQGTAVSSGANPSSLGITHPGAPSVNNRLIVGISYNGNNGTLPTISTVSDTLNTYVADRSAVGGNNAGYFTRGALYSANVVSASTPTVTVTLSAGLQGGDTIQLTIEEYSGLSTASNAVDVSTNSGGTLGVATSGATASTTAANELAVAVYADDGGNNTPSASGTGFTTRQSQVVNTTGQIAFSDADSGASGSAITATYTPVGTGSNVIDVVVYKLAAGGGAAAAVSAPLTGPFHPGAGILNAARFFQTPRDTSTPGPPAPAVHAIVRNELHPGQSPSSVGRFYQTARSTFIPATGDLTLAITGVLTTGSVGTLIPSTTVTVSGVAASGAIGTTVPDTAIAPTGVVGTGSPGSLTPSTTTTVSGVIATATVGTLAPSTTVALAANVATGAVGTVTATGGSILAIPGLGLVGDRPAGFAFLSDIGAGRAAVTDLASGRAIVGDRVVN